MKSRLDMGLWAPHISSFELKDPITFVKYGCILPVIKIFFPNLYSPPVQWIKSFKLVG
jgi:hypothetical protein